MQTTKNNISASNNPLTNSRVGERLKLIRERHGLSQRELSRRADITNGTLSNIENDKVSPSIHSLEKILTAFPMSLQEFFADQVDTTPAIFRADQMVEIKKDETEYTILPLGGAQRDGAYISKQTYHPGAKVKTEWMVRNGYIGGLVLDGSLTLNLEGIEHIITKGEGFSFSLHRPHAFINNFDKACIVVSVSFSE